MTEFQSLYICDRPEREGVREVANPGFVRKLIGTQTTPGENRHDRMNNVKKISLAKRFRLVRIFRLFRFSKYSLGLRIMLVTVTETSHALFILQTFILVP